MEVLHNMPLQLLWQDRYRPAVLAISAIIAVLIAIVDWWTGPYVSLGFLYLFPIIFSARFLPKWMIVLCGVLCAVAVENFSSLQPSPISFFMTALAVCGCGLLVGGIAPESRNGSKVQLSALAETSPAAVLTIDERGFIEFGNPAAVELLQPRSGRLAGQPIGAFFPHFHHELGLEAGLERWESTSCEGWRGHGARFKAGIWFSGFRDGSSRKVAAVITDVNRDGAILAEPAVPGASFSGLKELRPVTTWSARETEIMRLLVQGSTNRQIASQLEISESSVKNALQQLFAKTGVRTRTQLVRIALENCQPSGQTNEQSRRDPGSGSW